MTGHSAAYGSAAATLLRLALALVLVLGSPLAHAYAGPGALRAEYGELQEQLRSNNFQSPLYINSSAAGDTINGDVYAVLDHPFTTLGKALKEPGDWCDILLLPFNAKYCRAMDSSGSATLQLRIGRKADQPVQDAYPLEFALRPVAATPDYFESRLNAASGPLGTRDYRIVVSAVPLDAKRTFMHLRYSYVSGAAGQLAMQAYLATAGAHKVGFTITGRDSAGQPIYIRGVRGAIERTGMRYYLAIEAHLASMSAPADQQLEKRIESWFTATERHHRQLHEMDRGTYVAMKRGEYERKQAMVR